MLSLPVDCRGCPVLVSVLVLIDCVLDVRLFPGGVKSHVLLSVSHSDVYTYRCFHSSAHITASSRSSVRRQFPCLGLVVSFHAPSATPVCVNPWKRISLNMELSCVVGPVPQLGAVVFSNCCPDSASGFTHLSVPPCPAVDPFVFLSVSL